MILFYLSNFIFKSRFLFLEFSLSFLIVDLNGQFEIFDISFKLSNFFSFCLKFVFKFVFGFFLIIKLIEKFFFCLASFQLCFLMKFFLSLFFTNCRNQSAIELLLFCLKNDFMFALKISDFFTVLLLSFKKCSFVVILHLNHSFLTYLNLLFQISFMNHF